jgi:hypothetical protein
MTNIELARKTLERVKVFPFVTLIGCTDGWKFGNSWCDCWELDDEITREQLLYLISKEINNPALFESMTLEELDLEKLFYDMAFEGAWSEGFGDYDEDYVYNDCEYYGKSLHLERYIASWKYIIEKILSEELNESELEDWLIYFDDYNFKHTIKNWKKYGGEFDKWRNLEDKNYYDEDYLDEINEDGYFKDYLLY